MNLLSLVKLRSVKPRSDKPRSDKPRSVEYSISTIGSGEKVEHKKVVTTFDLSNLSRPALRQAFQSDSDIPYVLQLDFTDPTADRLAAIDENMHLLSPGVASALYTGKDGGISDPNVEVVSFIGNTMTFTTKLEGHNTAFKIASRVAYAVGGISLGTIAFIEKEQ